MLLSVSRGPRRAAVVLASLVALATVLTGMVTASPAQAANRVTPGNFTGYGFDQCITPSQEVMDTWLTTSPYWAVGVYMAGVNRHCGDDKQVHLTPEWVSTQLSKGWKILPITLGPQAPCYVNPRKKVRIKNDPAGDFAAAREQGRLEAADTVGRARALGIAPKSTLWYDIEAYDITNARCRNSSLAFLSGWTTALHNRDYVSGVYSSAGSGIKALDDARVQEPGRFAMPDRIWFADWIDADRYRRPPRTTPPSLYSRYFSDFGWLPGNRMRQYRGGHDETYGGVKINIDTNYLDLGRGTRPGKATRFCGGVQVDFPRYRRQKLASKNDQVTALQCLLRRKEFYGGRVSGYYNRATERAVRRFQRSHSLAVTGRAPRTTWTALLSEGTIPVVKIGSGGNKVRRVQRAMNAAVHAALTVDGIFGPATTAAVRSYQGEVGLPRTGVVDALTWVSLHSGRM